MTDQTNLSSTSDFTSNQNFSLRQLNSLANLINFILNRKKAFRFFISFDSFNFINPSASSTLNDQLKTVDVDYFDPDFDDNSKEQLINTNKHVSYKNVYAFINKLQNMSTIYESIKIKKIILACFCENALLWHFMKLTKMKKRLLRTVIIEQWYKILIKRFKKKTSNAIHALQMKQFEMTKIRSQSSRAYAQNMLRHVKTAEMNSTHNQLSIVWNNLCLKFKRDILKFTSSIFLNNFLQQLNFKINIWRQMINQNKHQFYTSSGKQFSSKQFKNKNMKDERYVLNKIMNDFMHNYSRRQNFFHSKYNVYFFNY